MAAMLKYSLVTFLLLITCDFALSEMCTRLEAKTVTKSFVESTMCNNSYEDYCSMFSSKMCIHYEQVPCFKTHNKTVTEYVQVKSCCKGWKWDPSTENTTCIRDLEEENTPVEVTKDKPVVSTEFDMPKSAEKLQSDKQSSNVPYLDSLPYEKMKFVEEKESLLLGLSHGAYAGIICFFAFLICVAILIILSVRKRHIRRQTKDDVEEAPPGEMGEHLMVSEQA